MKIIRRPDSISTTIYDNYVINVYYKFDNGLYTNVTLFHFDTFQLHLFYQNIAIG